MRALTSSIDAKDPYTCGHSERVALLSKRLAEIMGWSKAQAERIYLCGLLHDIGKIGVPEAVLQKPGKLTNIEFDLIKKHPVIGAKIIRGIQEMEDLVPGVLHHHECMDGRGYPGGLKGEAIPIQARVLCVADALDAMTSDRPYRKAMPARLAESEVFRAADTQFDSDLVEAVLKLNFPEYLGELRTYKGIQLPENSYDPQDQIHTNS
jgi:putative nucleotidyltransferase with HDIG domain